MADTTQEKIDGLLRTVTGVERQIDRIDTKGISKRTRGTELFRLHSSARDMLKDIISLSKRKKLEIGKKIWKRFLFHSKGMHAFLEQSHIYRDRWNSYEYDYHRDHGEALYALNKKSRDIRDWEEILEHSRKRLKLIKYSGMEAWQMDEDEFYTHRSAKIAIEKIISISEKKREKIHPDYYFDIIEHCERKAELVESAIVGDDEIELELYNSYNDAAKGYYHLSRLRTGNSEKYLKKSIEYREKAFGHSCGDEVFWCSLNLASSYSSLYDFTESPSKLGPAFRYLAISAALAGEAEKEPKWKQRVEHVRSRAVSFLREVTPRGRVHIKKYLDRHRKGEKLSRKCRKPYEKKIEEVIDLCRNE